MTTTATTTATTTLTRSEGAELNRLIEAHADACVRWTDPHDEVSADEFKRTRRAVRAWVEEHTDWGAA